MEYRVAEWKEYKMIRLNKYKIYILKNENERKTIIYRQVTEKHVTTKVIAYNARALLMHPRPTF